MSRNRNGNQQQGNKNVEPGTVAARSNETRRERRKQRGSTQQSGIKLTVNEAELDRDRYVYRWVKDSGARVQQLEQDDWDKAPEKCVLGNHGTGTTGVKIGGTDEGGRPYDMVLMQKEKDWYQDDQKEKQKPLDEMEEAIRRGTAHAGKDKELDGVAYTPNGQNTLSRN